jgi:hypothetical protein
MRLQELVHQLEILGDPVDDKMEILKFLHIDVQADSAIDRELA